MNGLLLAMYILANVFVVWRGITWLSKGFGGKCKRGIYGAFAGVYMLFAASLIVWVWIPKEEVSLLVQKIGNVWYGVFSILFLLILGFDFVLLCLWGVNKKYKVALLKSRMAYLIAGMAIIFLTAGFAVYGSLNAGDLRVNSYHATVDKKVPGVKRLRVALVADLHMGLNVGYVQIREMVKKINALNPDVVVMAGDIYDNDYTALDNPEELMKSFQSIKSKYGVYAVYGNHDVRNTLVGGFTISNDSMRDPKMEELLVKSGIHVLKDDIVKIAGGQITLIGRIDGEEPGEKVKRKSVKALMANVDQTKPVIMVNHEPDYLENYEKQGVDAFLGGHTHNGQIFPLTIVRSLKWKNPSGYVKVGNMHSFVTQGIGTYGPDMRTFSHSEIMKIDLSFR